MSKELTLPQYIEIKGVPVVAAELGVEAQTVHYWKAFRSAPKPHTAAKLVALTNGLLTFESIYKPYVEHNAQEQLEFDFMTESEGKP